MLIEKVLEDFKEDNADILGTVESFTLDKILAVEGSLSPTERYLVNNLRDRFGSVKEFLNSDDATKLVQPIIVGNMMTAAEPDYDIAGLLPKVNVTPGQAIEFPLAGEVVVGFVNQGGPYPVANLDFTRFRASDLIKVRKYGAVIPITEEMIAQSNWNVIALWLEKAGRAMRRFKNAWIYREIFRNCHVILDGNSSDPSARPSGIGKDGTPNGSLTYLDLMKMVVALLQANMTPTHICMNGYAWPVFFDNELLGAFGTSQWSRLMNIPKPYTQVDYSSTEDIIRRALTGLPQVMFSEHIPIDTSSKTFDIMMFDANKIGALLVSREDEIPSDQWTNPENDVVNVKVRGECAPAIYHNGRAIAVARNITLAATYPGPIVVKTI